MKYSDLMKEQDDKETDKETNTSPLPPPPGHERLLQNYDKDWAEPPEPRNTLSRRIAIFWYFWEFAIPNYVHHSKDSGEIERIVTNADVFLDVLTYIPWFILYEKNDWLAERRLLKTVRGFAMRVDGYHNLNRKDDKWQNANSKTRATAESLKGEMPKLYAYLRELKQSLTH